MAGTPLTHIYVRTMRRSDRSLTPRQFTDRSTAIFTWRCCTPADCDSGSADDRCGDGGPDQAGPPGESPLLQSVRDRQRLIRGVVS